MSNPPSGREPDMTALAAADTLSLHPETVRILARSGAFPNAYKTGTGGPSARIRIPWADVEDYRQLQPRAAE
ncbi:helix-turn-helix domain-containing protein [Arthrobacter sp. ok362]|uniref:helix-turn-helix domain-containing protein n=1 Tax=Arthrobacter sp. ok362 TaxID=1761745 RepID=UPI001113EA46|nr:helix-turn-helix domain-containing protein [Arthrobacter sp. ok362]